MFVLSTQQTDFFSMTQLRVMHSKAIQVFPTAWHMLISLWKHRKNLLNEALLLQNPSSGSRTGSKAFSILKLDPFSQLCGRRPEQLKKKNNYDFQRWGQNFKIPNGSFSISSVVLFEYSLFSATATFLSYCSFHRVLILVVKENVGEAWSHVYLRIECWSSFRMKKED